MSERPTLHEIANMPLSETLPAIRKFYDPKWGTEGPEFGEREFSVTIQYETRTDGEEIIDVRADSIEAAEEKAREIFDDTKDYEDEIVNVKVREIES